MSNRDILWLRTGNYTDYRTNHRSCKHNVMCKTNISVYSLIITQTTLVLLSHYSDDGSRMEKYFLWYNGSWTQYIIVLI